MFAFRRIGTKYLAGLCRRLGAALEAGIDARKAWTTEATRTGGKTRAMLQGISASLNRGDSLKDALAATGGFFPPMFRQLAEVGEQTGHLDEVLTQLADHYDNQLRLRRTFLGAIAWPVTELGIAVVIVGLLIWILGMIGKAAGTRIDPLGFGLVGTRGLLVYLLVVGLAGLLVFAIIWAVRRGLAWVRPIQRAVLRVPVLGEALQTLALARLAWSLHLTLNTEIDVRRAIRLSLDSTHNARYTDLAGRVDGAIAGGDSITDALTATGKFPADFLAAVGVGEQTGNLVEAMGLLSHQYQERARAALATLTMLAGFAVWALIAAIIIALIFRLAMFYIGTINDAMKF